MQCTANLRNNGEIDHIKLNWSKDNLLTRWSKLTGVDPPSFSSRKRYIYTCIHSPSNMRRAAAASHLWGPRPRRCRPGRHCRWSSAPGTGCSRPASPCTEEDNIIINFPNWRASPRLAQCRPLSGNCQFLLRNWWKRKLLCCPLTSFVESVDRWEGWKSTLQSTFTILNCQYFLLGPIGQNNMSCTYDFLCDWLIVRGVDGEEGVWGPKAELPEMSSASSISDTILLSSSPPASTQPGEQNISIMISRGWLSWLVK